ncbi:bile acid:sodium symporter [Hyphomicrobium nitrativorans NL23]|uniref:Bile acid:sodium symporter n=1 Tax=Hyphomicrobium nitrativorans NL23 TaxID=1029756 RepID=V5SDX4_9HYPH|nr:bile acid:sodium symporter [Hyphomicrobium nitrativorans]AHB48692.1 bile acid:sodium symporter [Hyphomicrobium nitrativorans NL23]
MTRETLERRQVWVYVAAIAAGLCVGLGAPHAGPIFEALLWPCLAFLLFATFTQVPLAALPAALRDTRFMTAVLIGNFAVLPLLVAALLPLLPDDPAVRLGVLLVLLVPCTDWFITFTHQAGGDTQRAIAVTPVVLIVQIVLLPVYLWAFMGDGLSDAVSGSRMLAVFLLVITMPLAGAYATERWAGRGTGRAALIGRLGWLPVPLLALVLFLIGASQVETVEASLPLAGDVAAVFVLFFAGAVLVGIGAGRLFRLPLAEARTLVFSFATRNSFVVLPLALALPAEWAAAAVVIVLQSVVELFGVLVLLWLAPRILSSRHES